MEAGALPLRPAPRPYARRLAQLASLAVTVAIVVAWAVLLRPAALGGPVAYAIVQGSSMEPALRSGDLVVARPEEAYRVGDVVVFRVPAGEIGAGATVIHRVVGGSGRSGLVLQGDNKSDLDPWQPRADDVVGKAHVHLPHVGTALVALRSPLVLALLAGLLTLLAVAAPSPKRVET
jgi:signal peptidase I